MEKKLLRLTPILATIIQFVLCALILFAVERIFPPKNPEARTPTMLNILFFGTFGLIETIIGYLVLGICNKSRNRNMVLLIYGILYLVFSICMGLLIGDNSLGKNDTLISICIFMVPAILYLIPYIYGTIRFYYNDH